jgi:RimJ/RimL family protein N-acetyltransferase
MVLETERLQIMPLTPHQLKLWVNDMAVLEQELSCSYQAEPMRGVFLDVVKGQLQRTENDQNNYMWHSFWFLMRKNDRVVLGSADFKNIPDDNGEVEIGYGIGKQFEHNGYMTEAVQSMCEWALRQPGVSHVIAETESDHFASQRILKRCGFKLYQQGETFWWRL